MKINEKITKIMKTTKLGKLNLGLVENYIMEQINEQWKTVEQNQNKNGRPCLLMAK